MTLLKFVEDAETEWQTAKKEQFFSLKPKEAKHHLKLKLRKSS